jgi:O-methyltransferase
MDRINGVWFGPRLTNMQKLCVRSYQDNGHEFHLYTDHPDCQGIPPGTIIHSVEEILSVQKNRERFNCESHFSDYFRVMLINKIGGWYVDLDTICLKHFDFDTDYVFVSENEHGGMRNPKQPPIPPTTEPTKLINGCIFKAPAGCDFLTCIIARIENMETKSAKWLDVGPNQFRSQVPNWCLERFVKAPIVFDAINPNELYHFVTGGIDWNLSPDSYVIHLRSSAWKEGTGLSPDKEYELDSLYEQLKKKHCVVSAAVPGPQTPLEEIVKPYTMVGSEKIRLLIDLVKATEDTDVPGDFVECGVCNGGSAAILAHSAATSRYKRTVHLFDSFEGLPDVTKEDVPSVNGNTAESEIGKCKGSIDNVKEVLAKVGADMSRVKIYPGWFDKVFPTVEPPAQIAMLNLDSDWYASELLCLRKFYDNVSHGGFVYFDDYYYWPGCQQAVNDYFRSRTHEFPPIFHQTGHSMWLQRQTQQELAAYWMAHREELRVKWGR